MKKNDKGLAIIVIILGIIGYFVFKGFQKGGWGFFGFDGSPGSGGGGGGIPTVPPVTPPIEPPVVPPLPTYTPSGFRVYTKTELYDIQAKAGQRQTWIGGTYGAPGQPSQVFKERTLSAITPATVPAIVSTPKEISINTAGGTKIHIAKPLAIMRGTKAVTVVKPSIHTKNAMLAQAAIKAGAPPRMVAKIKAGHAVLGGKY